MKRRRLLGAAAAGAAVALAGGAGALWLSGQPDIGSPGDFSAARRWLDRLLADAESRSTSGWPLGQLFEHAAQSIEYSIDGYPELRAAWFHHSIGAAAFAVFDRRGRMSHDLDQPIPGAPALSTPTAAQGAQLLHAALARFDSHRGELAPHFAFGALSRAQYLRAHLMHLDDHASRVHPAVRLLPT